MRLAGNLHTCVLMPTVCGNRHTAAPQRAEAQPGPHPGTRRTRSLICAESSGHPVHPSIHLRTCMWTEESARGQTNGQAEARAAVQAQQSTTSQAAAQIQQQGQQRSLDATCRLLLAGSVMLLVCQNRLKRSRRALHQPADVGELVMAAGTGFSRASSKQGMPHQLHGTAQRSADQHAAGHPDRAAQRTVCGCPPGSRQCGRTRPCRRGAPAGARQQPETGAHVRVLNFVR